MSDVFITHRLAEAYGWTPEEIENLPETIIQDHLVILDEIAKEEKRQIDAAKKGH